MSKINSLASPAPKKNLVQLGVNTCKMHDALKSSCKTNLMMFLEVLTHTGKCKIEPNKYIVKLELLT